MKPSQIRHREFEYSITLGRQYFFHKLPLSKFDGIFEGKKNLYFMLSR
jgi:hypothetical protein